MSTKRAAIANTIAEDQTTGNLGSLDEPFVLARVMEQEAASKHDKLTHPVRDQCWEDLAAGFAELANERDHVHGVTCWSIGYRQVDRSGFVHWHVRCRGDRRDQGVKSD